jgi:hypothetical protein
VSTYCSHPRLMETARKERCPDCGYEFYYGDAYAEGEAQRSRLIDPGRDARSVYNLRDDGETRREH